MTGNRNIKQQKALQYSFRGNLFHCCVGINEKSLQWEETI